MIVEEASHQKHIGIHLDEKLNFKIHIEAILIKANREISIIKKLMHTLPRKSLLTIYKAFLRPNIDYGDNIYDSTSNRYSCEMLDSVQYKAAFDITRAMKGTSRENVLTELDLESLKWRRWLRRSYCMTKIIKNQVPEYMNDLISKRKRNFKSRNIYIPSYNSQTEYFKSPIFLCLTWEMVPAWSEHKKFRTNNTFKQKLLLFIYPVRK